VQETLPAPVSRRLAQKTLVDAQVVGDSAPIPPLDRLPNGLTKTSRLNAAVKTQWGLILVRKS
jgi:hypothetical protein